jgi:formate dehydrogenase gamma subunit
MTSPETTKPSGNHFSKEEAAQIELIKKKSRARKIRAAQALAGRIRVQPDGSRAFLRFGRGQRFQHQVLLITFTTLGITGLLQRYSRVTVVGLFINTVFGGIETLRTIHHLAAFIFILETLYHLGEIVNLWFVKRERGAMWPRWQDFRGLAQMMLFNVGRAKEKPAFDRFSIEEKLEYWAGMWGGIVMVLTGLVMWFPLAITSLLPGSLIPVSRAVHSWEAVLAVLSILTWHIYHTVIKERNRSIFTGVMSEEEMEELHPLEYQRILAAQDYLQRVVIEDNPLPKTSPPAEAIQEVAQVG